jgi:hypothetical protein
MATRRITSVTTAISLLAVKRSGFYAAILNKTIFVDSKGVSTLDEVEIVET